MIKKNIKKQYRTSFTTHFKKRAKITVSDRTKYNYNRIFFLQEISLIFNKLLKLLLKSICKNMKLCLKV